MNPEPTQPAAANPEKPPGALPGRADPTATEQHISSRRQAVGDTARLFGSTGLMVSALGFGGYRVGAGREEHQQALTSALTAGFNLVDTSSNYADGESERLMGRVLFNLVDSGRLRREAVIVVTKGGYIQGENLQRARRREAAGEPFPGVIKIDEQLWYSIHPDFLADQLRRSQQRLGVATIDAYLLHNPEYILKDAGQSGASDQDRRRAFRQQVKAAFAYLEEEAARGSIAMYGVSSNTLASPAGHEGIRVGELMELAREVSPHHHFRVVQMPGNLLEPGFAAGAGGDTEAPTPLAAATEAGLAVMLNRPLNAIVGGRLLRLADPDAPAETTDREEVKTHLERLARLETQLLTVVPREQMPAALEQGLQLGRWLLEGGWSAPGSWERWRPVLRLRLLPAIQGVQQHLAALPLTGELAQQAGEYGEIAGKALGAVDAHYRGQASDARQALRQLLTECQSGEGALPHGEPVPLSQVSLTWLRSLPGVATVLLGMRRVAYVNDALTSLTRPPLERPQHSWAELARRVQRLHQE